MSFRTEGGKFEWGKRRIETTLRDRKAKKGEGGGIGQRSNASTSLG